MKRIMRAGLRLLVCLAAVFVLCGSGPAFAGGNAGTVIDVSVVGVDYPGRQSAG